MEGGSAKKPVTKVVGGGSAAPSKGKTTRGGSAKGGSVKTSTTKPRQHIGGVASKTVRRGPSIKKGGSDGICYQVTRNGQDIFIVKSCEASSDKSGANVSDADNLVKVNKLGQVLGWAARAKAQANPKQTGLFDDSPMARNA